MVPSTVMQARQQTSGWLEAARKAMEIEAEAVATAATRLDGNLSRAVDLILDHPGKLVVTGLGKSGHVARKIVATLCSTGTPSVFLHAAEASHGDLGIYAPGDPTLMVSKSSSTMELLQLIPFLRELPSQRIGILGNPSSRLAEEMDVVLDASVEREADPENLAPPPARLLRWRSVMLWRSLSCARATSASKILGVTILAVTSAAACV